MILNWQALGRAMKYFLCGGLTLVGTVCSVHGQQRSELTTPRAEVKATFGSAIFGDDIEHKLVGGAVRVYVTKRLSIEPEYLYL